MPKPFDGPVERYPAPALSCRDLGHSWTVVTDFRLVRNTAGHVIEFTRALRCPSCTAERHDTYDTYMRRQARRYIYPDGYQTPGDRRITSASARMELVRRLLGDTL